MSITVICHAMSLTLMYTAIISRCRSYRSTRCMYVRSSLKIS